MNAALIETLEQWSFMAVGVFTTCCFTRDFAPLDLVRFPQVHHGSRQGNIVTFELPSWFPHEQAIFSLSNRELFAKVRDLPLPRQVKASDSKIKYFGVQLPTSCPPSITASLTYSPLFRFAHTGPTFDLENSVGRFICRIIEYAARRSGLNCGAINFDNIETFVDIKTAQGNFFVSASGHDHLNSIVLSMGDEETRFDFERREMTLSHTILPKTTSALSRLIASGSLLANCNVYTDNNNVHLQYRQQNI